MARLLLGQRADDGSAAVPPVLTPGTAPGAYRPTPPAFAHAVFTHWPAVTPFVLDRAGQFRPRPYPALDSARYARALNEVAATGRDTSTTRTADQTEQARFWAAPIWNYWNEIAQSVVSGSRSGLFVAARVFAQLNLTFADAVIAFYEAKYHYRIWRPITAVRLAADDGNPATDAIPDWSSLGTTPADPAYPGAHSVIAQAGAQVLRQEYGPRWALQVTSEALPNVVRRFTTFQDAADEAGLSRIAAGVHTRLDHDSRPPARPRRRRVRPVLLTFAATGVVDAHAGYGAGCGEVLVVAPGAEGEQPLIPVQQPAAVLPDADSTAPRFPSTASQLPQVFMRSCG